MNLNQPKAQLRNQLIQNSVLLLDPKREDHLFPYYDNHSFSLSAENNNTIIF